MVKQKPLMKLLSCVFTTGLTLGIAMVFAATATVQAAPPHGKKDKDLPPGLQKKVLRGEPLPPGWQKKLHPGDILSLDIYERGVLVHPRNRDGIITIRVEGELIRLYQATREIVDILSH